MLAIITTVSEWQDAEFLWNEFHLTREMCMAAKEGGLDEHALRMGRMGHHDREFGNTQKSTGFIYFYRGGGRLHAAYSADEVASHRNGHYYRVWRARVMGHPAWRKKVRLCDLQSALVRSERLTTEGKETDPQSLIIEALRARIEELEKCSAE